MITSPSLVVRAALFLALVANPAYLRAADQPPLALERTIALADVAGRIDHMAVDLGRGRLFVAELGNGTLEVVDIAKGIAMHRIDGLGEPQGVAYSPKSDVLAITGAGDGSVRLFRGANYAPAGKITLGEDADNIRLDARSGNIVVGYGTGGMAVIDPARAAIVSRTKLPAHPEGFQLEKTGLRAFVNVPDAGQIAVLDLGLDGPVATWRLPTLRSNFPMAIDGKGSTIAVAFRAPPQLALLAAASGTVLYQPTKRLTFMKSWGECAIPPKPPVIH